MIQEECPSSDTLYYERKKGLKSVLHFCIAFNEPADCAGKARSQTAGSKNSNFLWFHICPTTVVVYENYAHTTAQKPLGKQKDARKRKCCACAH